MDLSKDFTRRTHHLSIVAIIVIVIISYIITLLSYVIISYIPTVELTQRTIKVRRRLKYLADKQNTNNELSTTPPPLS